MMVVIYMIWVVGILGLLMVVMVLLVVVVVVVLGVVVLSVECEVRWRLVLGFVVVVVGLGG